MGYIFEVHRLQRFGTNAKNEEHVALALYRELLGYDGKGFKFLCYWKILKDVLK
jgi:hypothetical protein